MTDVFKKGMLSTEIEFIGIWEKKTKAFQNIIAIFKINSINFRFFVFMSRASTICSRNLLISWAIIVVFSTRIF